MKALAALSACLLVGACTTTPTSPGPAHPALPTTPVAAGTPEPDPQYPSWLEMKPGYAEACIQGGGCIPMTQGELNQLAADIMQRTLQACRRVPSI